MSSYTGDRIRQYRKEKGLTQKQLGDLCGMADSAIRRYESGRQNPKIETLQKLASALNINLYDLRPTGEELEAFKKSANTVTNKRITEIDEKRLTNLIKHKEKVLNISGKQRVVDYMDDLTKIPEYRKDSE